MKLFKKPVIVPNLVGVSLTLRYSFGELKEIQSLAPLSDDQKDFIATLVPPTLDTEDEGVKGLDIIFDAILTMEKSKISDLVQAGTYNDNTTMSSLILTELRESSKNIQVILMDMSFDNERLTKSYKMSFLRSLRGFSQSCPFFPIEVFPEVGMIKSWCDNLAYFSNSVTIFEDDNSAKESFLKMPGVEGQVIVESIDWIMDDEGKLIPHVDFKGVDISLRSKVFADAHDLGKGAVINVLDNKEFQILKKGEKLQAPRSCTECSGKLTLVGMNVVCKRCRSETVNDKKFNFL